MNPDYLDFEQPIAELQAKIEELRYVDNAEVNLNEEIAKLEEKANSLTRSIFSKLTPRQISQLARHPKRPYTLDLIEYLFTDFRELHGDRAYADDKAIIGGLARFQGRPVMVIGHQKGRNTKDNIMRNFGMPRPEGYRKALRLMRMAEKFNLPVITFIDTPGAYPGIGAEERGQSEAIARNLYEMAKLRTPIICTVVGEGGSGGALGFGVADRVVMLSHSIYSVISPEGCASILWKTAEKAEQASEALALTAEKLKQLGIVEYVVDEGEGAHLQPEKVMQDLKDVLQQALEELQSMDANERCEARYQRLMKFGSDNSGLAS